MLDEDCWNTITELLSVIDHSRRPAAHTADPYGAVHLVLFGDFKQLPPATSKAPFIVIPAVVDTFEFRVLRENRRAVGDAAELEEFHQVLTDVAWGTPSPRVRKFIVDAYVRGAGIGSADRVSFEGATGVFTKRRYRDKWNRTVVHRIARTHSHSLKVKGKCRARGTRGENWYHANRVRVIRRTVRTQSLWNLQLAGDWHAASEIVPTGSQPHLMRVMLVANLAVDQRFANGTQGRLLYWHPAHVDGKKGLPASHPELLARFAKESAMSKREMFPDIDHMDVTARSESLATKGAPVLLQLPVNPAYGLTVHKVQSLSIKHLVLGCLEGVFALGQVYVLFSRVIVPLNCQLVGMPPSDLIDAVAEAFRAAGLDVDECFKRAATVTGEWVYTPGDGPVSERVTRKYFSERALSVKWRTLEETLNPQPLAAAAIKNLLGWIDRADLSSQRGAPRPDFSTPEGDSIFPDGPWWLTELQTRVPATEDMRGDEDGPATDDEPAQDDCESLTDNEDGEDGESGAEDGIGAQGTTARAPEVWWHPRNAGPVLPLARKRKHDGDDNCKFAMPPEPAATTVMPCASSHTDRAGSDEPSTAATQSQPRTYTSSFMRACGHNDPDEVPDFPRHGLIHKRKHCGPQT